MGVEVDLSVDPVRHGRIWLCVRLLLLRLLLSGTGINNSSRDWGAGEDMGVCGSSPRQPVLIRCDGERTGDFMVSPKCVCRILCDILSRAETFLGRRKRL